VNPSAAVANFLIGNRFNVTLSHPQSYNLFQIGAVDQSHKKIITQGNKKTKHVTV